MRTDQALKFLVLVFIIVIVVFAMMISFMGLMLPLYGVRDQGTIAIVSAVLSGAVDVMLIMQTHASSIIDSMKSRKESVK